MSYSLSKRFFDVSLSCFLLTVLLVPLIFIAVMIKLTSKGPVIYWSDRVGINNKIFKMPKFRSMRIDTPPVATHLLKNPKAHITPVGLILRRFSLDELPQLFSIISGDLSFVGPRPALFNQADLVALRSKKGIQHLIPGLTGWAQVNGRDNLSIPDKVEFDEYYLLHRSFIFDIKILFATVLRVIKRENIRH